MRFWQRCMAENLPLASLRIAVTRPREQAAQLVHAIEKLGGTCIQFPLLEITPLTDTQPLHAVAARLHEFQLAIFISPNAVRYGMEVILSRGGLPPSLQVATVGLSSAKALHDLGVKKVISPQLKFDSESLLALPELQNVRGLRVAIFRGDSGRELLGDTLKARGAIVEYVTCYHRSNPQHDASSLLAAKPDAICVSSTEALNNLWTLLESAGKQQLSVIPLCVTHERIAAAAHKLGWQNIVIVAGSDNDLLLGLPTWAAHRKGEKA